jgi:hypothetical protein
MLINDKNSFYNLRIKSKDESNESNYVMIRQ